MFWSKRTILLGLILALALFADVANADYIYGTPTDIGPSSYTSPSISTDGLSLYVDAQLSSGYGGYDIWVFTREMIHDDWPAPVNLGPPINSSSGEGNPDISADGLTLFISCDRPGGHGDADIWQSTRATRDEPWSEPVNLGPTINSPYYDSHPSISTDGLALFFTSTRPGGYGDRDTWLSTRATTDDPWSEPVNLGPVVNSPFFDSGPDISSDGLMLFFDSRRPGGYGGRDIWVARRATTDDPWSEPVNLGPIVNTSSNDFTACISADGSILYFWSNGQLRQVPIDPVVDLNSDGVIDSADLTVMVNHWGEDYASCDIGPMPWGDGVVDAKDLVVIGEHMIENADDLAWSTYGIWQADVDFNDDGAVDVADILGLLDHWGTTDNLLYDVAPPPLGDSSVDTKDLVLLAKSMIEDALASDPNHALTAHWALDETEGNTANDSVNGNNDFVLGDALWQPTGGVLDGALEFDGVDDCIIALFAPNPADGPFSIFAWVNGGAPGQVIVSQPANANWLIVDADGKLMTELAGSGEHGTPLQSQNVITDDQWHRIGLVWDGSSRMLCVDGVVVAEDTQSSLEASGGGLYIGVGKYFVPGTFFSGLIDDVRIYNRAVHP